MQVLIGDAMERLKDLETESVQCCVTSPPYWQLRDYGVEGQIGLEDTPEEYIDNLCDVFMEVHRTLAVDGVCWINISDTYNSGPHGARNHDRWPKQADRPTPRRRKILRHGGYKYKDLIGIPWMLALGLRNRGWYLRSQVIWHKDNARPCGGIDRPQPCYEVIYLLSKSERYYYNGDAIREPSQDKRGVRRFATSGGSQSRTNQGFGGKGWSMRPGGRSYHPLGRPKRDVWTISTQKYAKAHFATFPPDLIEPCILAGSRKNDTVLDPFAGSGTVGKVALEYGRNPVLIELNPDYEELINERCFGVQERVF